MMLLMVYINGEGDCKDVDEPVYPLSLECQSIQWLYIFPLRIIVVSVGRRAPRVSKCILNFDIKFKQLSAVSFSLIEQTFGMAGLSTLLSPSASDHINIDRD